MRDWIERNAAWFLLVALVGLSFLGWRLTEDEAATRHRVDEGARASACLLELLRADRGELSITPRAADALEGYLVIQGGRYAGVKCSL